MSTSEGRGARFQIRRPKQAKTKERCKRTGTSGQTSGRSHSRLARSGACPLKRDDRTGSCPVTALPQLWRRCGGRWSYGNTSCPVGLTTAQAAGAASFVVVEAPSQAAPQSRSLAAGNEAAPLAPPSAQSVMQAIGRGPPHLREGLNHFYCRSCHHDTASLLPHPTLTQKNIRIFLA